MSLTGTDALSIEQYVAEQITQPVYFPPFTIANKPTLTRLKYRGIYILDTSKPAWMDPAGAWRYGDGTLV